MRPPPSTTPQKPRVSIQLQKDLPQLKTVELSPQHPTNPISPQPQDPSATPTQNASQTQTAAAQDTNNDIPNAFSKVGQIRGRMIIFFNSIRNGLKTVEMASKESANSLFEQEGWRHYLGYGARGLELASRGLRIAGIQLTDTLLSPNVTTLWTLASAAFMMLSPFGPTVGMVCLALTVATTVGNLGYKGYQLYNLERVRREHRILTDLTDLDHEFQSRVQILRLAGVMVPEGLGTQPKLNYKDRLHNSEKAVARGFLAASPDMIMGIFSAAISGNVLSYVLGAIAVIGDGGAQMHNANEAERSRVELVNDVGRRKAALGLEYTGRTGSAMADAINGKRQALRDQFKQIEELETKYKARVEEVQGHFAAIKAIDKQEGREALLKEYHDVKQKITGLAIVLPDDPNFSTNLAQVQQLNYRRVALRQELHLDDIRDRVANLKGGEKDPVVQFPLEPKLIEQVEKDKTEGVKPDQAPQSYNEYFDAFVQFKKAIEMQNEQDTELVHSFDTLALVSEHIKAAPPTSIPGQNEKKETHFKLRMPELQREDGVKTQMQRHRNLDNKDNDIKALSPITRFFAFLDSLAEMLAAGMSRSATSKLYDPKRHYSGKNYYFESVQMIEQKAAVAKALDAMKDISAKSDPEFMKAQWQEREKEREKKKGEDKVIDH